MEKTTYHILNVVGGYWLDKVEASSPAEALEAFAAKRRDSSLRELTLRAVSGTYVDVVTV